jgi:uncharacterized protein (DUF2141 family)
MRVAAFALALALAVSAAPAPADDPLNTLTVQIENADVHGGRLIVGVYDRTSFDAGAIDPILSKTLKAKLGTMSAIFVGIAPGDYAIKAVLDVNANTKRDKSVLGEVSEPVGYSRVVSPRVRPAFRDAKFTIYPGDNTIVVRMQK